MRMRTLRMMAVLILGAGSWALAVAQTKIAEKDAPVATLERPPLSSHSPSALN